MTNKQPTQESALQKFLQLYEQIFGQTKEEGKKK
jgi:hypothetical protein